MFLKGTFWIIKIHDLHKFQHVFPMIILFDIKPLNKLVKDGIFLSSSLNLIYPLVAIYYANGWYDTSKKKKTNYRYFNLCEKLFENNYFSLQKTNSMTKYSNICKERQQKLSLCFKSGFLSSKNQYFFKFGSF